MDAHADRVEVGAPVSGECQAVLGAADEFVGDGQQQVVGVVEVPADRTTVGLARDVDAPGRRF
ncbi:hypothetical protein ACIF6L_11460 [Kitasatospora sp. NPDC086009]|uniref:hypothetical protein n=1 Tax=unclassified Kitasatospora TaxID=2633591 RepID=UPI0037CBC34A